MSPTAFRQHAHAQLQPAASQALGSDSAANDDISANGFAWSQYQLAGVTWQIYKYAKANGLQLTSIAYAAIWDAQTAPGDLLGVFRNTTTSVQEDHQCSRTS